MKTLGRPQRTRLHQTQPATSQGQKRTADLASTDHLNIPELTITKYDCETIEQDPRTPWTGCN